MKYLSKLKDCFKCPLSIFYLGLELMFLILTYANLISVKDFCLTFCGYIFFNLVWTWIGIRAERTNGIKLF